MRIICDHCGGGISGRVQRVAENLNFHPECLGELFEGPQPETTAITAGNHSEGVRRPTDRVPLRGRLPVADRYGRPI